MQYLSDLVGAISPTKSAGADDDRAVIFRGTVGEELNVVALDGSKTGPSEAPLSGSKIAQQDRGILVNLSNFTGKIRISSVFPHDKEIQLIFEQDYDSTSQLEQPSAGPGSPLKKPPSILRVNHAGKSELVAPISPNNPSPKVSPRGRKRASVSWRPHNLPAPFKETETSETSEELQNVAVVGQGVLDMSKFDSFGASKHWADHSFRPQDAREGQVSTSLPARGLAREKSNYDLWDPAESDYASALHEACDSPFATLSELEDALHYHPDTVSKQDEDGKLPLHILSNNLELIKHGGEAGREMATSFAKKLIKAYPNGALTTDSAGRVPFTDLIRQWIEWTYESDKGTQPTGNTSDRTAPGSKSFASRLALKLGNNSDHRRNQTTRQLAGISESGQVDGGTSTGGGSLKKFPPAEITEEVDWCFDMLSVAMDLSGGKTAAGVSRPLLSYQKQLLDREKLASEIASIPLLLKTIFLLESNSARTRLLNSSIVKRVLLSPESVGPWVTSMLRYRPIPSRLAVDYFELISTVKVEDYIGDFRKASPGDFQEFRGARETVYDAIMELGGTIPSLVVLDEKEIERAASTRAIYFVMSKSLTQPLVVALVVTDFVMQITVMLAFRGFASNESTRNVSQHLLIDVNQVIIIIGCYLLFREIINVIALARISVRVLLRHVTDLW